VRPLLTVDVCLSQDLLEILPNTSSRKMIRTIKGSISFAPRSPTPVALYVLPPVQGHNQTSFSEVPFEKGEDAPFLSALGLPDGATVPVCVFSSPSRSTKRSYSLSFSGLPIFRPPVFPETFLQELSFFSLEHLGDSDSSAACKRPIMVT